MAKETTLLVGDRLRASRCETHIVVWFAERDTTNTECLGLSNGQAQIDFIEHAQYNQMTARFGLKVSSGFQTGMTNLHDLIGQR
jgi:hypothetical protein